MYVEWRAGNRQKREERSDHPLATSSWIRPWQQRIDSAYWYRRIVVACLSLCVCLSVGQNREPCKNGETARRCCGLNKPCGVHIDDTLRILWSICAAATMRCIATITVTTCDLLICGEADCGYCPVSRVDWQGRSSFRTFLCWFAVEFQSSFSRSPSVSSWVRAASERGIFVRSSKVN